MFASIRSFETLVPCLYPFFRHTLLSVRSAVVTALNIFLDLEGRSVLPWLDHRTLRILYQNLMVEESQPIRAATARAWNKALTQLRSGSSTSGANVAAIARPLLPGWFDILMTPLGQAVNTSHLWKPSEHNANASGSYDVDKAILKQDLALIGPEQTLRGRLAAAEALAELISSWPSELCEPDLLQLFSSYLTSASSHQIAFTCYLIVDWCRHSSREQIASNVLLQKLGPLFKRGLEGEPAVSYAETVGLLNQIHGNCQQLVGIFRNKGKVPATKLVTLLPAANFSLQQARQIVGPDFAALSSFVKPQARAVAQPLLEELRQKIVTEINRMEALKDSMDTQVFAALAAAAISLRTIPSKLNPLIRSLMNGLKFESNVDLQARAAVAIASFLDICNSLAPPVKANPTDKILKNITSFLYQDTSSTPLFSKTKTSTSLFYVSGASTPAEEANDEHLLEETVKARLARRGSIVVIQQLSRRYGDAIFKQMPKVWEALSSSLLAVSAFADANALDAHLASSEEQGQNLMDALTVLAAVTPLVTSAAQSEVLPLLPYVGLALQSSFTVVRHVAATCLSDVCTALTEKGMQYVVNGILSFAGDPLSEARRSGAIELISRKSFQLGLTKHADCPCRTVA